MLALAIGYTVYGTATKEKVELVAVGSEAPDFTLVDLNGEKHKLSDYKGQGVFLNFWGTCALREGNACDGQSVSRI